MSEQVLISINNCRIENSKNIVIPNLSWEMKQNEAWLIIGPNGGGKAPFINALSSLGGYRIIPNEDGARSPVTDFTNADCARNPEAKSTNADCTRNPAANPALPSLFSSTFKDSVEIVSLERAALLIQEERENDESEYIEGGVDIGRTGRVFIAEGVCGKIKKGAPLPEFAKKLEGEPAVKLCGIEKLLDRGLKYMSTGEIRRTLLARALVSGKKLLIFSDPFAGLDIESRTILGDFFNTIAKKAQPSVILGMERWHEIPDAITNVLEFSNNQVSFCGTKQEYLARMEQNKAEKDKADAQKKADFSQALQSTIDQTKVVQNETAAVSKEALVEMNNVNVGWGDNQVLKDLNWKLVQGEHWLIRGPNGSGKTTFLELITGDNMQVFSNDIKLFGNKRGSGESIWDIKKQLGIVSYRLHVEYRMLGGTNLLSVILSGFKDSIGLYEQPTDSEVAAAKKWLSLGGFEGREMENFGNLSYGEQRAILILRSAVKVPKILILDEPCHGLDEAYRQKILQLMEKIGEGGTTTMLHVTHDPSEVLECEKHILELHPGENPMYKIIEQ